MIRQDWSSLKKLLFFQMAAGGGAAVETTATGNPLTFVTDLARPLKSLLIPFTPQQSGTGDPSPENIRSILPWDGLTVFGGGKNLLNPAWWDEIADNKSYVRYDTGTLVYQAISYKASDYVSVMGNTEYTLHAVMRGQNASGIAFYDSSKQYISGIQINNSTKTDHTFTTPSNAVYMRFWDDSGVMPWNEVMLVYGSNAPTAYEPYQPITETDIVFPALGKNLLPPSSVEYGSYGTTGGKIQDDNNKYRRLSIDLPAGNYVFSTDTPNCYFIRLLVNDSVVGTGGEVSSKAFTLTEASNVKIAWRNTDTSAITDTLHNQIETGSTPTAYEPFNNTVYGGTLDVVSGLLTVEWAGISATWGDGESATDMGSGITRKVFPMVDYLQTGSANNMCNIAPYSANESANVHFYYSGSGSTNRKCRLFLPSDTPDTTVVTVVTKLSQTYEVQLTGEQITALLGNNTMWSDADGQMTATYLKKG